MACPKAGKGFRVKAGAEQRRPRLLRKAAFIKVVKDLTNPKKRGLQKAKTIAKRGLTAFAKRHFRVENGAGPLKGIYMNIIITAPEFDPDGTRILRQEASALLENRSGSRRVSRTATLDGGAIPYDTGYAAADRTIRISTDIRHLDWLSRMVKLYAEVRVSTEEGLFYGIPSAWSAKNNRAGMDVLILREA